MPSSDAYEHDAYEHDAYDDHDRNKDPRAVTASASVFSSPPPPNVLLDPSVNESGDGIWFASPPGFMALPLEALLAPPESAAAGGLSEAVGVMLASAPDEVTRQRFVATLATAQRMFHALRTERTVHCSLGLHRDDTAGTSAGTATGSPLLSSLFTITWLDTAWAPRGVTAARAVMTADGHSYIAYEELPSGPATFSETRRTPTPESGFPQKPLLQIHAHLPHPDGTSLALLTLSTTAVAQREHYRGILRLIADTVSFEDPFAIGLDGRRRGKARHNRKEARP